MNHKKTFFLVLFMLLAVFFLSNIQEALSQESAEQLYEAALFKKEADGDLQGAVQLFLKIITDFPDNRKIAAKAQLQIGICYEKLGLKQAQKAFQEVIDKYPEQTGEVKVAREKLSFILKVQAGLDKGDRQFRMRKLWENLDMSMNNLSTVSPGGQYIAFTDRDGGDLAVLDLDTKKRRRLTDNFSLYGDIEKLSAKKKMTLIKKMKYTSGSIWAPDGQKIAYGWSGLIGGGGCDLCIISLAKPESRVLLHIDEFFLVCPLDWTSDGKNILAAFLKRDMTGQFVLVKVADGSIQVLKQLERPFYPSSGNALFLPDEKHIVYDLSQENKSSEHDIFLYYFEEGKDMKLVEHPADDFILDLSPNGEKLFFASNRRGSLDFWIAGIEGGQLQKEPLLVHEELGEINPLGFDKSGSFYYGKNNWTSDIYTATYNKEKAQLKTSPEKATQKYEGSNLFPNWSPDGKSLAYMSSRISGGQYVRFLCILSEGTDEKKEFRLDFKSIRSIKWSPDGGSILVSGNDPSGQLGIYEIDVQTGYSKKLKTFGPDFEKIFWANWLPDKKKLYYTVQKIDESVEKLPSILYVYDIESGREQELISHCLNLSLSPNGDWLAFSKVSWETLLDNLYVMPSVGGDPRKILTLGKNEAFSTTAWAPDGKSLVFAKYKDNISNKCSLWEISLDEEKPQKLGLEMNRLKYLSLHPDGQSMAFCSSTMSVDIWVMENFLPKNKKEVRGGQR